MTQGLKIGVLGDGGWGTTLSILLHNKGHEVTLWGAFDDYIKIMDLKRENKKFLPGIKIPDEIKLTHDIKEAAADKEVIVLATPSQFMRPVLEKLDRDAVGSIYVSVSKGIETKSLLQMSEVVEECLGNVNLAVLSGPTISYEVARGMPTTAVAASKKANVARKVQEIFSTETFRVYTSSDVVGVELGGSLKNIIAIAAGISDGLGFGTNSKSALLTRGLVEITRLGVAMGAKEETFFGLSGLGDLVTTCINPHGRNRWFGEQVGKGRSPREVIKSTEMVIEGIPTATSAYSLARKYNVEMPITEQIYNILYKDKSPKEAVRELMLRPMKAE